MRWEQDKRKLSGSKQFPKLGPIYICSMKMTTGDNENEKMLEREREWTKWWYSGIFDVSVYFLKLWDESGHICFLLSFLLLISFASLSLFCTLFTLPFDVCFISTPLLFITIEILNSHPDFTVKGFKYTVHYLLSDCHFLYNSSW